MTNEYDKKKIIYNPLGFVEFESYLYRNYQNDDIGIIYSEHDGLYRPGQVDFPVIEEELGYSILYSANAVEYQYNDADPNFKNRYYYNGSGQVVRAIQDVGSNQVEAAYTYDVLGRLIETKVNPLSNPQTRTWEYNLFGKLVEKTDPESGKTVYTYNNAGILTKTSYQSTSGDEIAYVWYTEFDAIYRPGVKKISVNGQVDIYRFEYDSTSNSEGRLSEVSQDNGGTYKWNTYDQSGNCLTFSFEKGNSELTNYDVTYEFNSTYGYLEKITYPEDILPGNPDHGPIKIQYFYDSALFLPDKIKTGYGQTCDEELIKDIQYSPTLSVSLIEFGNGKKVSWDYNIDRNYKPNYLEHEFGSDTVRLEYNYDQNRIMSEKFYWNSTQTVYRTDTFEYNTRDQLTAYTLRSGNAEQIHHSFGDSLDKYGNNNYFGNVNPANNRKIDYTYDDIGQLIGKPGTEPDSDLEFVYSQPGKIGTVKNSSGSVIVEFLYDSEGRKIWKSTDNAETQYLVGANGETLGQFTYQNDQGVVNTNDYFIYAQGQVLSKLSFRTDQPPDPTPTPDPAEGYVEMILDLNNSIYFPGDQFTLNSINRNEFQSSYSVDQYIVLEVYGSYFFWPGWRENIDHRSWELPANYYGEDEILSFIWPGQCGSGNGLSFLGAFFDQGTSDLICDLSSVEFSFADTSADYYVDGSVLDDTGHDGSQSMPWNRIQKALQHTNALASITIPLIIQVVAFEGSYFTSEMDPIVIGEGVTLRGSGAEKTFLTDNGNGYITLSRGSVIEDFGTNVPICTDYGTETYPSRIQNCVIAACNQISAVSGYGTPSTAAYLIMKNVLMFGNQVAVGTISNASVFMWECTVSDNSYYGIYAAENSQIDIHNSIICKNGSENQSIGIAAGDQSLVQIDYTNLYNNSLIAEPNASIVQGLGIQDANPRFLPGPEGLHDYFLENTEDGGIEDSPCIDAGNTGIFPYHVYGTTSIKGHFDKCEFDLGYRWLKLPQTQVIIKDVNDDLRDDPIEQILKGSVEETIVIQADDISIFMGESDCYKDLGQVIEKPNELKVEVVDVIGNEKDDLIVTVQNGVLVFENDGTGIFIEKKNGFMQKELPSATIISDIDGDTHPELIVSDALGTVIYRKSKSGPVPYQKLPFTSLQHMISGDIDGDGDMDLLTLDTEGNLRTYLNASGKIDSKPSQTLKTGDLHELKLADTNSDSAPDLICYTDPVNHFVYFNNGKGLFTREIVISPAERLKKSN